MESQKASKKLIKSTLHLLQRSEDKTHRVLCSHWQQMGWQQMGEQQMSRRDGDGDAGVTARRR